MHAYRRYRARRQAAFTRENVARGLTTTCRPRAPGAWRRSARSSCWPMPPRSAGRPEDGAVLDALAAGERAHLAALEAFRGPLHAESVEPEPRSPQPSSALGRRPARRGRASRWPQHGPLPRSRRTRPRARLPRHREALPPAAGGGAGRRAPLPRALGGGCPSFPGLLSSRPACGLTATGRRPAFCTVCTKPGFEFFEDVEAPAAPGDASAALKPEGAA